MSNELLLYVMRLRANGASGKDVVRDYKERTGKSMSQRTVSEASYRTATDGPWYVQEPDHHPRSCICCDRPFMSTGAGNRFCRPCLQDTDGTVEYGGAA